MIHVIIFAWHTLNSDKLCDLIINKLKYEIFCYQLNYQCVKVSILSNT